MKLLAKLLLGLLFLGVAGLFVLKTPDGKPILSTDKITDDAKSAINKAQNSVKSLSGKATEKQKVYRWKDAEGKWQYSNVAPSDQQAEAVKLTDNVFKTPKTKSYSADKQLKQKKSSDEIKKGGFSPTTISAGEIPKLINDAKNVQQLMDDRDSQIKQSLTK